MNNQTETMKAVICTRYGSPDVLQIKDVPKPIPKENQFRVKIHATAVNSGDVRVRGLVVKGFMKVIMRLVLGITKPRKPILGTVFSGVVDRVGSEINSFKVGDEVFGMTGFKFGCYAEFIVLDEKSHVIHKPKNASFGEAAALPFGGQTAIYFLEKSKISEKTNPKVLIYGATGSVGLAAIQIAQSHKAELTVVCSSQGEELVRSLGVENVVLYDKEDFTKLVRKFDIIFDAVGKTKRTQCKNLLSEDGIYKSVGGMEVAAESKQQLEILKDLYEKGQYKATIDKIFSMNEVVAAHKYVDTERKKGNVVLRIH